MSDDRVLPAVATVSELADYLGVSYRTVARAIEAGQVPGVIRLSDKTIRIVAEAFINGLTHAERITRLADRVGDRDE